MKGSVGDLCNARELRVISSQDGGTSPDLINGPLSRDRAGDGTGYNHCVALVEVHCAGSASEKDRRGDEIPRGAVPSITANIYGSY